MQAFVESMSTANLLMVIGIIGAVITIPVKDFITLEFYDICDVFISLFLVGMIMTRLSVEAQENMLLLAGIFLVVSLVIILIKIFVFVPFQEKAETNALLSRKDYIGELGRVTVAITKDGLGEVVLYTVFGNVPMTAKIYQEPNEEERLRIATGEQIRVRDIQGSIVFVAPEKEKAFLPPLESRWGK
ncbi:NfeD family protein [Jeotgalibaca caeni]|uniref:NfeD family protein n=1 Tax=Jeotgalibaca caeni TaxID=3028623 RepID=UPI00237E250D|nr:NfeD family protein [Jeotgalibaca caeni]MDE1549284.1 NfeD family protein [Jeotgalibaca caeni]